MKKYFAAAVWFGAIALVVFSLRPARNPGAYDVVAFGRLPTLVNGRIKPLDTVARTTLLMLQGRQRVTLADGSALTPTEWLLDVLYRPARADEYATFEITHPDVLALLNLAPQDGAGGKRFSLRQFGPQLSELDRQAKLADAADAATRTAFQRAVVQLRDAIALYQRLQGSLVASGDEHFLEQLARFERALPVALATMKSGGVAAMKDSADAKVVLETSRAFSAMDDLSYLRPIPPRAPNADPAGWTTAGAAWNASLASGAIDPAAHAFAVMGRAWQDRDPLAFNRAIGEFQGRLERELPQAVRRAEIEARFNAAQPFYLSMELYVAAFLLAVISWLKWPAELARAAFALVSVALALTTAGILTRMWLENRPPVTNLYSSALFVGWAAVALCVVLEAIYRNAIGSVAAGLIGFATLLISHHLAFGGDTLEMMRAVLDSNFWLATHVVTITVGYSATFLAGFLAAIYIVRGTLTRSLDATTAAALSRMIYGIVCFATLFSLVGTVLGGIWADQSWGRFWGWDPKENGALLIVMWNAILLHVRWSGLLKARGLAALAVFGNIVTAWSWFGVNMLGVGLHSYGFMDAAFWWLIAFVVSQAAVIVLAMLPSARWRSAVSERTVAAG